jgi:histidine triad (HIT) family protein
MKTLFERIIEGQVPAEKVFENEKVIAIKDIHPKAPVHILIIPKKPIPDLQSMESGDYPLLAEVVKAAKHLATEFGIEKSGYRLLVNNGLNAGQTIFHLHFHLLGGAPLGPMEDF